MTKPILAPQDQQTFLSLKQKPPHGLIIVGEKGLDVSRTSDAIASSTLSDVSIISPLESKRDIAIEQIRDAVSSLRTFANKRRVIIVRSADQLSTPASNSLLKMLEEPPEATIFILESSSLLKLLPTVISRCQIFVLHRTIPKQDTLLLQSVELGQSTADQIRFLSAGRPESIRDFVHNPSKLEDYREMISSAKLFFTNNAYGKLVALNKYSSKREDAIQLIDIIITLIRFQLKAKGYQQPLIKLLDQAVKVESDLKSNGHVKLALLQLII